MEDAVTSEIMVGVIGDFNPAAETHLATNAALKHAAEFLSIGLRIEWIATPELKCIPARTVLRRFHALWCAPGSPYKSMIGALEGIRFARESDTPFFGT